MACALASLVRAQDASESPAASPSETSSSSSSLSAPSSLRETSAATPEAKASASVETPKAQAATAASPSAEKKKSTVKSEDETTSASSENTGPDKGKPETVVKKLENDWETAVMKHDTTYVESRVAKDFIGISSRGKKLNKAALLKEFKTDSDTYTSAKNGSLSVHAVDKNVVVACGTAKEVGKSKDGAKFDRSYLFTDTWVLRGERWECVASQVMLEPAKK
jgi:hypothetical protein